MHWELLVFSDGGGGGYNNWWTTKESSKLIDYRLEQEKLYLQITKIDANH